MSNTPNRIRPLALALVENNGKILAKKDFDHQKQEYFYRIPGGGIEFGETSDQTLRREMKEELDVELEEVKFLGVLENIFTYEGDPGHEITFVYRVIFSDKEMYKREELVDLDSEDQDTFYWFDREKLLEANFYPEGVKEFVS